jgi:hypothetical protein
VNTHSDSATSNLAHVVVRLEEATDRVIAFAYLCGTAGG